MNPQEIEKIKSLIQTSGILSASERAEWLALLGMMNDRQLNELEKILNGGVRNKQASNFAYSAKASNFAPPPLELLRAGKTTLDEPVDKKVSSDKTDIQLRPASTGATAGRQGLVGQDRQQPVSLGASRGTAVQPLPKAVPAAKPATKPSMPPLSHIVNLPKNFGSQPQPLQKPGSQGVTPQTLAKRILETQPQSQPQKSQSPSGKESFAASLKSIFSEKELPPGIKNQNLESSSVATKETTLPATPITVVVPVVVTPPPVVKAPPLVPKPSNQTTPSQPKVLEKTLAPALAQKPSVSDVAVTDAVVTERLKAPVQLTNEVPPQKPQAPAAAKPPLQNFRPQTSGSAFSAGINFAKPSYKTTEERVAEIKQSSQARPPRAPVEAEPKISPVQMPVVGLESLDSLTQVNLKNLEKYSLDSLVAKIGLLTKRFGYFDVIFNLEKSPAYKVYIQTGLKLLSDQQDFEHMDNNGQSGDYLNRENFEKFTDLLSKIQTST